jgi:hypothetical protein
MDAGGHPNRVRKWEDLLGARETPGSAVAGQLVYSSTPNQDRAFPEME